MQVSPRASPKPLIAAGGDRPSSAVCNRDDRKKVDDEVGVFCVLLITTLLVYTGIYGHADQAHIYTDFDCYSRTSYERLESIMCVCNKIAMLSASLSVGRFHNRLILWTVLKALEIN